MNRYLIKKETPRDSESLQAKLDRVRATYRTGRPGLVSDLIEELVAAGMPKREISRRTGVSPGAVTQIHSLRKLSPPVRAMLDAREITFRAARCLARLPAERQIDIAEACAYGRVEKSRIERIVQMTIKYPALTLESLGVEDGQRTVAGSTNVTHPQPDPTALRAIAGQLEPLTADEILEFAGRMEVTHVRSMPEYQRLRVISAMKTLKTRVSQLKEL